MCAARRKINKGFLVLLAVITLAGLAGSAFVGLRFGNSVYRSKELIDPAAAGQHNTADQSGTDDPSGGAEVSNTADPSRGNENTAADPSKNTESSNTEDPSGTGETSGLSAKELAAAMQDYTIDPTTGRARDIKVVDDNYLILVNRTHALTEDYIPEDLVTVSRVVTTGLKAGETDKLRKVAAEAFEAMAAAAEEAEINIKMRTGYRSYEYQRDRIYDQYVKIKGQEYADIYSAKPGQSEHQTGLALDITGESDKYELSYDFQSTKEGKWLLAHCYEYGFIFRYTDGSKDVPGEITGCVLEPWHLRYVGVEAAKEMHSTGQLLEQYLGVSN